MKSAKLMFVISNGDIERVRLGSEGKFRERNNGRKRGKIEFGEIKVNT